MESGSGQINHDIESASTRLHRSRFMTDETWTDFLRNTSGEIRRPVQGSATYFARDIEDELSTTQMTTAKTDTRAASKHNEHRRHPLDSSGDHDSALVEHADPSNPTSSQRRSDTANSFALQSSRIGQVQASRRVSSVSRALWQPDGEVSTCPVCRELFTWYFRKHHCRKCGRVVCTNCSQHRITIPRQYVVQPPYQSCQDHSVTLDNGPPDFSVAETVRVCDSCVPEPNINTLPQQLDGSVPRHYHRRHFSSPALDGVLSQNPLLSHYRPALSHWKPPDATDRFSPPQNSSHRAANSSPIILSVSNTMLPQSNSLRLNQRRASLASAIGPSSHRVVIPSNHGSAQFDSHIDATGNHTTRTEGYRQRPQLAEEDECPVCGNELPLRNVSDDDAARTRHVNDCIKSYSSYSTQSVVSGLLTASPNRSSPVALRASSEQVHAATGPNIPVPVLESAPSLLPASVDLTFATAPFSTLGHLAPLSSSSHASSTYRRPARMLDYKANEKDCVDDRGDQQECVICFEEFEVGDDLGRLECMCKFHKRCIMGWWRATETSNPGLRIFSGCPTHVLQI